MNKKTLLVPFLLSTLSSSLFSAATFLDLPEATDDVSSFYDTPEELIKEYAHIPLDAVSPEELLKFRYSIILRCRLRLAQAKNNLNAHDTHQQSNKNKKNEIPAFLQF